MCLRTDGRWRTWMERDADAALRTILTQFVAMGVVYAVGPVRPPHSAPNTNYHLLGWRSTVQTSAHERRKGTLIVRWRTDILAHLCPRLHWLWVTVEPAHITGTRQRGGCSSEGGSLRPVRRVLGSEPLLHCWNYTTNSHVTCCPRNTYRDVLMQVPARALRLNLIRPPFVKQVYSECSPLIQLIELINNLKADEDDTILVMIETKSHSFCRFASMVSHRCHNCIFSALTILDNALIS